MSDMILNSLIPQILNSGTLSVECRPTEIMKCSKRGLKYPESSELTFLETLFSREILLFVSKILVDTKLKLTKLFVKLRNLIATNFSYCLDHIFLRFTKIHACKIPFPRYSEVLTKD